MKIEKSAIASRLGKLKNVISGRTVTDALQGVLFKDNCLTANNLEIGVKANLEIETDETFIIPLKAIELIESLPDGIVEITTDKSHAITIKTEGIKNKFQSFPPESFPAIQSVINDISTVSISSSDLQDAINSVMYAVAAQHNNQILTGLLFDSSDGVLNIVGCDGFRLAWSKLDYDKEFKFVVPKAAIQKLMSIGISGEIQVSYDSKTAIFKSKDYIVSTRLLEGSYLNYKKMFPKYDNTTIIDRTAFIESLRRSMICADDRLKGAVKLQLEESRMHITSNSSVSEYAENIKLEAPIDAPIAIGFNAHYIVDCLRSFSCEKVEVSFGQAVQPMVVDDGRLSAIVLPVKLNA